MFKRLIAARLSAFERRYHYDMSYLRHVLKTRLRAFLTFASVTSLSTYRDKVPLDAWYAAKLAATLHEDCGPCTQLVMRMAEEAGVSHGTLRAILQHNFATLNSDAALGLSYAEAVLTNAAELDDLRDEVRKQWGERGLVSLAFGITSSRLFPTLKRALGYAQHCSVLDVAGERVAFTHPAKVRSSA